MRSSRRSARRGGRDGSPCGGRRGAVAPYGDPWRDLPACFGHRKTVYNRYRRWAIGVWGQGVGRMTRVPNPIGNRWADTCWVTKLSPTRQSAGTAGRRHRVRVAYFPCSTAGRGCAEYATAPNGPVDHGWCP
ncbi:MAG: transposase [Actinophytocola sp.]|nr:transposase [Actinophytocola sp.]